MGTQNKYPPPSPEPDSVSTPPPAVTVQRNSGDHISLSSPVDSPLNSPVGSRSSPLHSKHESGGHISLSPPVGSPENSPARSSLASEHAAVNQSHGSSPEHEKPYSPEKGPRAAPPGNSPTRSSLASEHTTVNYSHGSSPETEKPHSPEKGPPPPAVVVSKDVFKEPMENRVVVEEPMVVVNRAVLEESKAVVPKMDPVVEGGGGGSGRRRFAPRLSILRRAEREKMVRKAALGFRVFGFLFCLISFSVMAADRNQGWALDSFDRYREFRYCMSVNVIGFVYSGAQAFDLSYNLVTGKYIVHHQQKLRYYFDFAVDQIIAYLLISASSSAVIRIDDWQLNWGKDKFPDMATASISMSFLAFVSLALSSLISGYALCTWKSL